MVCLVARNKGKSVLLHFFVNTVGAVVVVLVLGSIFGGNGLLFSVLPLISLIVLSFAEKTKQAEVRQSSTEDLRKCQFCAELVRKEAIKCKHCGSTLTAENA